MKTFTDQEYMELCLKLAEQQYDDPVDDYDVFQMEWYPDEPKQPALPKVNHTGMIDLTDTPSGKIKDEIFKCGNIKVGSFKIIISDYRGTPSQTGAKLCCNLKVMAHQSKTMNGMPCNMDTNCNLHKDNRFHNRPWLKYFGGGGSYADNIPMEVVAEIVRWLQAIKKMSAFL